MHRPASRQSQSLRTLVILAGVQIAGKSWQNRGRSGRGAGSLATSCRPGLSGNKGPIRLPKPMLPCASGHAQDSGALAGFGFFHPIDALPACSGYRFVGVGQVRVRKRFKIEFKELTG